MRAISGNSYHGRFAAALFWRGGENPPDPPIIHIIYTKAPRRLGALRAARSGGYRSRMTDTPATRELLLVHSSDLHVDDERIAALHGGDGTGGLGAVLATARAFGADIVLLAGDTFDNHMVTTATIDRAGRLLADAGLPVVILPGNHDPATPDSIWLRGRFDEIGNVAIFGITNDRVLVDELPRVVELVKTWQS